MQLWNLYQFNLNGVPERTNFGQLSLKAAHLPFKCTDQQKNFLKGDLQKPTCNRYKFFIIGDFNAKADLGIMLMAITVR